MADSDLSESGYAKSTLSPRLSGVRGSLSGKVREFQGEGNNSTAQEVTLTPYAPPNLQVSALTAPERAVRGQTFRVEYSVTNSGGASETRSEEHTSELRSLMRISYAVFCLKKKKT